MSISPMSFAVVVPVLNAAGQWEAFEAGLRKQTLSLRDVLILDSSSSDGTPDLAQAAGYSVISIPRVEFNHGGTRQLAIDRLTGVDVIIFLTQDAVLVHPEGLREITVPFENPRMGATYGRQLPRAQADAIEAHARIYNYPLTSQVKTWEDRNRLGIKATFLSNSFSAYRRAAIQGVGGFPTNTIVAEDALVAGKLLMNGWKTAYVATAEVIHSHGYSVTEEFARYFDTGVYHSREAWLLETFGCAQGEGTRFVISELKYLLAHAPYLIPSALVRTGVKFAGYKLGRNEARLSADVRRRLSMHKGFWDKTE